MIKPPLDLSGLALNRTPASSATRASLRHRTRWISRYVLPGCVLCGFALLLIASAGQYWLPTRTVTTLPVIVKRTELQQPGSALFQAPGWIEPRPMAVSVAAMTPGVIEELMVVAGQSVQKGEPIAKLVSIDAELALEQAKNSLAIREGELNRAQAELTAARARRENPVHLRVQLADAQSNLTKTETELAKLPYLVKAAEANAEYAKGSLDGKQSAKGAVSDNVIARAKNDHEVAIANLQELRERMPNLQREVKALRDVVVGLEQQLKLLVEETRQLGEAQAKVQAAEAHRDEAKLQVRQAELALDRCTVRAPMNGRILQLVAAPGSRVMGLETTAGQSSSTVAEMYDPQRLQVRTDVRLENVPIVTAGQPVDIATASSSQTIRGRVLQVTSSANIQKNTLEVKVELLDPPATVGPEMLVTATFLAPTDTASAILSPTAERIFVPRSLLQARDSDPHVWIVDVHSMARKRPVKLGGQANDELLLIESGLQVTDKLISHGFDGLRDGSRVVVTGDDQTLGIQ